MAVLGRVAKGYLFIFLIALLLIGLPIAVWLDLSDLVEANLRRQASDVNSIISSVRHYYANNVVGRILASPGTTKVVHNYRDYPGAIPIPATLSLELGKVVGEQQKNIKYRFVSDYPFKNRTPHAFDEFEADALSRLRQNSNQQLTRISSSVFSDGVRLIAPVMMELIVTIRIRKARKPIGRLAMSEASKKCRFLSQSAATYSHSNTCWPILGLPQRWALFSLRCNDGRQRRSAV
jgi:mRNA-degrading endonuclease toxin of MazEF toxin-antitoxin module